MKTLLPLLALVTACTGEASFDANNPLSLDVGPEGGTVESGDVILEVPAGAVASDVTLTAWPIERNTNGLAASTSAWTFGPDGQTFATPITVRFKVAGDTSNLSVWWTREGDDSSFELLPTTFADGWASALVSHFSDGVVASEDCGCDDDSSDDDDDSLDDDSLDDDSLDDDDNSSDDDSDDDTGSDDDSDDDNSSDDDDDSGDDDDDDSSGLCVCDLDDDSSDDDDGSDDDSDDDDGSDDDSDDDIDDDTGEDDDTDEDSDEDSGDDDDTDDDN